MSVNRLVGASNGYAPVVATAFNVANGAGFGSSPVTVAAAAGDCRNVLPPCGPASAVAVDSGPSLTGNSKAVHS
jgi:hypothetical protein